MQIKRLGSIAAESLPIHTNNKVPVTAGKTRSTFCSSLHYICQTSIPWTTQLV